MKKTNSKETARERELRVLDYWKKEDVFKKSVQHRNGHPSYVFYEGPPTANGMPHIGHVLGRVMKDFVARYKTMKGFQVHRKAGWDTHGLPVELGVEKQLGISGKHDIENYGVEKFVKECKSSVFHYENEWRKLTEAIGYWVDMDNPYVTLEDNYIESVWHLLSEINKKGLLYKGHRVSPYCPCCQTTLSSHEVAQGYEDVKDLSVTAKFLNEQGEYFLAWTTTPWTLPSNVALAVHKELEYAKVKQNNEVFVVAKNLVETLFNGDYDVLSTHKGEEFVGLSYTAPFQFVSLSKAHKVVHANYVSDTSGTGVVHLSPAHGEDDYKAVKENNLDFLLLVDSKGCYTKEVAPLAGRFVKDCDVDIIKMLSEKKLLFSKEKFEHSYPFCWRCKSPLLYYASESWFIQMTALREQLVENNSKVEWFPHHVKDGRFGNFLKEVVDWNISRNRYWGTPLNVWECKCGNTFVPSSKQELKENATVSFTDLELHKPYVDKVKVKCSCGNEMVRVSEVVDVWFDSGSMPYAQHHYPFENKNLFNEQFPADMVCEGIDQTRGWFYSLMAIGTLVYGTSPYKRVMALGHVLDEKGQKMSKSKGNVVDPWDVINEFGTDAFRWSLLADSNPWNAKKFSKSMVQEAKSKVVDTLMNVYQFYTLYASIDKFDVYSFDKPKSVSVMDKWLLSRLHSTLKTANKSLEEYDFLKPAKLYTSFVDELSNWYVRRSRERFWKTEMDEDKLSAYFTLHEVLVTLSKVLAPYMPFMSEDMYYHLSNEKESVHLEDYPLYDPLLVDKNLEEKMSNVVDVVELARQVRNNEKLKNKQPLSEMFVVSNETFDLGQFEYVVKDEVNVKKLSFSTDNNEFTNTELKLNFKVAGPKFGKSVSKVKSFVEKLSENEKLHLLNGKTVSFEDLDLSLDDLLVENKAKEHYASASFKNVTVVLNTELTEELLQEGLVREVVRFVQDTRKKLDLKVEERVVLSLDGSEKLLNAVKNFEHLVFENVLATELRYVKLDEVSNETYFDDLVLKVKVNKQKATS